MGLDQVAATTKLTGAGLLLGQVTKKPGGAHAAGTVFEQDPAANAQAVSGASVNVSIAQ